MGKIKYMPKSMRKRKHAKEHDTKRKKLRENNGHSDARLRENNGYQIPANENKPILSEALSK
jgi:hypothetical protein